MEKEKIIVHPGEIIGETDGDVHFISATQLIHLYNVNPNKYNIIISDDYPDEKGIHISPLYNGKYEEESRRLGIV